MTVLTVTIMRGHSARYSDQVDHYASFVWLPLENGQRAEPIITQLAEQRIAVSAGQPFAVTDVTPQAIRVAFGGIPISELKNAIEKVRDAIAQVS